MNQKRRFYHGNPEKRKGITTMEGSSRKILTIVAIMTTELHTVGETAIKMTTETANNIARNPRFNGE